MTLYGADRRVEGADPSAADHRAANHGAVGQGAPTVASPRTSGTARVPTTTPPDPPRPSGQTGVARVPAQAPPASPSPVATPAKPGRSWPGLPAVPWRSRRLAVVAGGVAVGLVAAAAGVGGYAYAGDVPRGTTVLGVDIGARSRAEAAEALRAELARRQSQLTAPVPVRVGDVEAEIRPADVGLTVDVAATVAAATRDRPGPIDALFGTRAVAPVVTVDPDRLDEALRSAAPKARSAMTKPAIRYEGTTPKPVYPRPGTDLDPARSADALRAGWLGGRPVEVPLVEQQPATTREDVDRLVADLATPAVAAPVTVKTDRGSFTIPPAAIARSLILTADADGRITPRVDAKKLRAAVAGEVDRVEVQPREATVSIGGGKPRVVASTGGTQVDMPALATALLSVLPREGSREVAATMKTVQPKDTTEEMAALGIKERVSSFTTRFTGGLSSPRSQNIVQIAKEVDGAVVKPGETFSLNGHTGPRGYAQGYKDAPVILDGKLVPGVGGGASQFTTTLFNATYYAGLEDVEHKPHSYWFSRYPPVIESTIFYPDLDFKFRNDTPYGVLLDTSYTSSTITVSVWSTKYYDSVTTKWSARRNITQPPTVYLEPGPDCIATDGLIGFGQDAWRIFRKDGKELRREKFSWRYDPEPRFVCAKKPA